MCLRKLLNKLEKVENVEKKVSTKGFLIFSIGMIVVILTLVVILSLV